MSGFNFDSVNSIIEEVARENGFQEYNVNVKNKDFTGINYSSNIIHAQIESKSGDKQNINLLIKFTDSTDREKREQFHDLYDGVYKTELLAYTSILPTLSLYQETQNVPKVKHFTYPKFYKGGIEYLKEYMALEDLSCQGFMMYEKKKPVDFEHGKVIMENMARYHAISFAMKEKNPENFQQLRTLLEYKDYNFLKIYGDIIEQIERVLFGKIAHQIKCDQTREIIENFIQSCSEKIQKCLTPLYTEPHNVICHGDIHINNMMFAYTDIKPKVFFIDWQWMRYASPVADIVHLIYSCSEKQFRDENLGKLCEIYYETLTENLTFYGCEILKIFPKEVFEKHLKYVTSFGISYGILSVIMILNKEGEEKRFDEIMKESAVLTLTDEMYKRLKGYAEDIVKLTSS